MNTYRAYQYQLDRLTADQKVRLNEIESKVGRSLLAWEISEIFKLTPYVEERAPRKRRLSDEVENNHWSDQ